VGLWSPTDGRRPRGGRAPTPLLDIGEFIVFFWFKEFLDHRDPQLLFVLLPGLQTALQVLQVKQIRYLGI